MIVDIITKKDVEAAKLLLRHSTNPDIIKTAQDIIKRYKEQKHVNDITTAEH